MCIRDRRFLAASSDRLAANVPSRSSKQASVCSEDPKEIYSGNNKDNTVFVTGYDTDCDGKANFEVRIPVDKSKPISWAFDRNGDGKPDLIVFDYKRTNYFEFSLHDVDFDGTWDLVGYHTDGKLKATRFERYDVFMAKK